MTRRLLLSTSSSRDSRTWSRQWWVLFLASTLSSPGLTGSPPVSQQPATVEVAPPSNSSSNFPPAAATAAAPTTQAQAQGSSVGGQVISSAGGAAGALAGWAFASINKVRALERCENSPSISLTTKLPPLLCSNSLLQICRRKWQRHPLSPVPSHPRLTRRDRPARSQARRLLPYLRPPSLAGLSRPV